MMGRNMSMKHERSNHLKNTHLSLRPGSLLHFFVWMIIDTMLMLLVTLTMVVMVNKVKELCFWIKDHSWVTIVLILIGTLPILVLSLLKLLGYRREIDHFLIGISFVLCSMGFASVFKTVHLLTALAASGATIVLTAVALIMALYLRNSNFLFTITLFAVLCASVLIGIIMYIVEYVSGSTEKVLFNCSIFLKIST
ncbi:unnamed protein product [Trichobilharzia szidati]|nr:unnamed protein product [Trichobilharzia szidati]